MSARAKFPRLRAGRLVALAMSISAASCLAGDDRPPPGNVLVRVEASAATTSGFATSDGWTITFDRLLAGIGDVRLGGDNRPDGPPKGAGQTSPSAGSSSAGGAAACNDYTDSRYERLFDFVRLSAPSKVAIDYGLGHCDLHYRVRSPSTDAILETGTTDADVTFMRTEATDAYATDARVTVLVRGKAVQGGVEKHFDWDFRTGFDVTNCKAASGDADASKLTIAAHDALTVDLVVSGEELFRAYAADDAPLAFNAIASADADGDGSITLEELATVDAPPSPEGTGGGGARQGGAGGGRPAIHTMADLVYEALLPRLTRIAGGGACDAEAR